MSVSTLHKSAHGDVDVCPWCEQSVSHEKFEEIRLKIQANERAQTRAIERRLTDEYEAKAAQANAAADLAIAKAKRDADTALANAAVEREVAIEAARAAALAKATEDGAAALQAAQDAKSLSDGLLTQERAASAELRAKAKSDAEAAAAHAAQQTEVAVAAARQQAEEKAAAKLEAAEAARQLADRALVEEREGAAARLMEQRSALEEHAAQAVASEQARAFAERQKLERTIDNLKRQVQNKTAGELGEGAELDLYDELRREFPTDDIRRVKKGLPGADIIHKIIENGAVVGCVVYDSKNRVKWRNDYVTKLRVDQLAEKADHAILATPVFPAGQSQLATQDGVIIASPARVVTLAQVIRGHIVHVATLRLSETDRAEKMAAVYDFVTSDRCSQLFAQMETLSVDLLELEEAEKASHDKTWRRRGELVRNLQKTQGTLANEIDLIVMTAGDTESSR